MNQKRPVPVIGKNIENISILNHLLHRVHTKILIWFLESSRDQSRNYLKGKDVETTLCEDFVSKSNESALEGGSYVPNGISNCN